LRYLRWASIEKPAIFWSIVVGSVGPVLVVAVPPIRNRLGDPRRPDIPLTYPSKWLPFLRLAMELQSDGKLNLGQWLTNSFCAVPAGPRKPISGYDD
jgi:hypothetical protein